VLPENPFASPPEPIVPSPRPRVWTVWLVFVLSQVVNLWVVVVLLLALTFLQYAPGSHAPGRMSQAVLEVSQSPLGLLSTVSATMILFAGAAAVAAALSPVPWRERLRLRRPTISPPGVLVHICGVLGIGLVFGSLMALDLLPQSPALTELGHLIEGLTGPTLLAFVLVIGIAPGIAEELLFRGYIQTRFSQRWGPGQGIFWTSVLFGVMHMDLVHGMFAFALGLYLGYLTERTGSIRPAIICHAGNNVFSTLTTAWYVEYQGVPANLAALVGGVVIVAASLWHLRTFVKPQRNDRP
jgi:membrane protease YdiL (CAAX protease family)